MAPRGVSIHTSRIIIKEVERKKKLEATHRMNENVERAAAEVASLKPSVIVYGCTTGSFVGGLDSGKRIVKTIEDATGIPAVTASTSVIEAFRELNLKRIAVATPYIDEKNVILKEYVEGNMPGSKVDIKGLQILELLPKGMLYPSSAYSLAREITTAEHDGIFLSCTNWRTIDIIGPLERDLSIPVVSSNQANMWAALEMAKVHESINGYGKLLEEHLI